MGKLSAVQIKNIHPENKLIKYSDGDGLFLHVTPKGQMYWRYHYRYNGKQKTLALGVYPDTSLKQARLDHQGARAKLMDGIDPAFLRKITKKAKTEAIENTFGALAWEWFAKQQWTDGHRKKQEGRLNNDVLPFIGGRPADGITGRDVLGVCLRIESRGVIDGSHRVKTIISQIFRYGVAKGIIDSDPARDLRGALTPYVPKNMATIIDPDEIGGLMRAIAGYKGNYITRAALHLAPLTFVRPGELRHAEWSEMDFNEAIWRIPAKKMKKKRLHLVPLSRQSLAAISEIQPITGEGKYLFPSVRSADRPMSDNTVNAALRRMGYTKKELTGHGFRGMASTLLHEQGYDTNIIEMQLAHKDPDAVRGAYNHAKYLTQRVEMMQAWADYLDKLRGK